jgi:hypothetical protein
VHDNPHRRAINCFMFGASLRWQSVTDARESSAREGWPVEAAAEEMKYTVRNCSK